MSRPSPNKYLNERRIFTRDGGRWGIGTVHRMLTRPTYIGRHEFNKRSKSKALKPADEVIPVAVPPIIDRATFDAVQARMKARNPKVTPPQVVGGPTLLTGLIHCAKCGGAMTIRTGKGGRYRYYTCSTKARQGPTACSGITVPMEKLDTLVAKHLEKRLLDPARLEEVLAAVLDRRQERTERRREHIAELNKRATETELRLKRLYDAIESGIADLDDPDLKDRIASLKAIRDQSRVDADRASAMLESAGQKAITAPMLSKFAQTARQRMRLPGGGYRRDHLRALAQRVEVNDGEVRIMGSKSDLLRTLAAGGSRTLPGAVPSFVPRWRRERDCGRTFSDLSERLCSLASTHKRILTGVSNVPPRRVQLSGFLHAMFHLVLILRGRPHRPVSPEVGWHRLFPSPAWFRGHQRGLREGFPPVG